MRCRLLSAVVAVLLVPTPGRAQPRLPIQVERDIVFGKGGETELKLDLARPDSGAGPFPAVVCLHGGGWVGGDRKEMAHTIEVLARRRYVAVTPDYRLAPRHRILPCPTA